MSAKCSIYFHEKLIHFESLLMKYGIMSLTQNHTLNPDSNITICVVVEIISYLSIDELKGLSNEWFIRHNTW